jgi:Domain of unknown function (DUF4111)/Nucleotidyltransferase domain
VGVYAGGSYALGDYLPERSDLDVAAVVRAALPPALRPRIVAGVAEEAIHCPARKLELVVYRLETARSGTATPDFELNLNTGAGMPLHVDHDASQVAGHWFPIDRSVLAQAGIALRGAPAREVFTPIPPRALAPVLADSVRWYRNAGGGPDAVLNACRALRFATDGRWSSKPEAGRWAVERAQAPPNLVASARAARTRLASLDPGEVAGFLEAVESRLRAEAASR